jgi:DNA/RNA endonuclease G (NUC1)
MTSRKAIWIVVFLVLIASALVAEAPIVYITKTGEKYHTATCSYLGKSKIPIYLSDAICQGYTPCSRCKPPVLVQTQLSEPTTQIQAEAPSVSASIEDLCLPYCEDPSTIQYYTGFALLYSEEHEPPAWVAYLLTDDEVLGTIDRSDNFREYPQIITRSASLEDNRGSGYDRGHLA